MGWTFREAVARASFRGQAVSAFLSFRQGAFFFRMGCLIRSGVFTGVKIAQPSKGENQNLGSSKIHFALM
ncbi:hypothetical protein [uncultured Algoriphagus sp.]|uniref:hypothetical protein n=1 Tax=uncultured Algoriphagus sp. TaxID=417365 RepID=UPI0030EF547B|tara:strand:- start:1347 stop:1556 length:210 start_codon:yes stop_codon:yes gene_type:complete